MIAHAQRAAWIHLVFPSILGRMTSTPTTTAKVFYHPEWAAGGGPGVTLPTIDRLLPRCETSLALAVAPTIATCRRMAATALLPIAVGRRGAG